MSVHETPPSSGLLAAIEAAVAGDNIPEAIELAERAMAEGLESPLALNLVAYRLESSGRFLDALPLLQRVLILAPSDAIAHNGIGRIQSKLGRPDEALPAFETAIRLAPGYSAAHTGRGLALESLGRPLEAEDAFQTALALDPANVDALGALAALKVARREPGAEVFARRALASDSRQPAAVLALATLDHRAGRIDAAAERLDDLLAHGGLAPLHEANALRLLADVRDGQGRFEEAMKAYVAANKRLREVHGPLFEAGAAEDGVNMCRRLQDYFRASRSGSPAGGRAASPSKAHVFLVGFPRSGTTLLEQVLASHPEIVALEERPTLGDVGAWFASEASLAELDALDDQKADALRAAYWATVRSFGVEPNEKVFVDKQPLDTLWLPYIAKLFPSARILFARRDPRDVVLSCFRRRFRINGATFHFTDIAELARFYSSVMALADVYRETLDLTWRIHRHEDLVEDFDHEARAVCDFVGVEWVHGMRDFAETAKRRDVRTPSADQVRRGLYREGMGQWRAYAAGMADALPILQPWVERFGYADV